MVSDTLATTAGVVAARFAQNFSAIKLEKGASPADAKAKAGKPLYIGIGTAVPVVLGFALRKLAKQERIGNALIVGGLTFAVAELARQLASKAPETSPLYALGDDLEGAVAQGDDGTEWAYVAGRGWHRIDDGLLPAARMQRRVRTLEGFGADEDLGGVELRDTLGGVELRDTLGEVALRDTLGDEETYVGADWDSISGVELRDTLGTEDDFVGSPYGYGDEG